MGKRLYVGSLPFQTTEPQLAEMFAACGTVASAKIITDKLTGRSKGFGFIEMSTDAEADGAKEKMNGFAIGDRKIVVNEARPMEERKSNGPSNGGGNRRGPGGPSSGPPGGAISNGFSNQRNHSFGQPRQNSWGGGNGGHRSGTGQGESRGPYNPNRNSGGGFRDANKTGYQGGFRDNGGFNSRGDAGFGARRDAGRRRSWGDQDSRRQGHGGNGGGANSPPRDDNFGNR